MLNVLLFLQRILTLQKVQVAKQEHQMNEIVCSGKSVPACRAHTQGFLSWVHETIIHLVAQVINQ